MNGNNEGSLCCSFCRKNQDEVSRLIGQGDVYICPECIELCNGILLENQAQLPTDKQPDILKSMPVGEFLEKAKLTANSNIAEFLSRLSEFEKRLIHNRGMITSSKMELYSLSDKEGALRQRLKDTRSKRARIRAILYALEQDPFIQL
ncbi:MAG: hypothetical protein HGB08_04290 [Candidatus Moranbacteria bacterium]|nr:hypothetical protein [Candidatus Moranbacteria bacterium]